MFARFANRRWILLGLATSFMGFALSAWVILSLRSLIFENNLHIIFPCIVCLCAISLFLLHAFLYSPESVLASGFSENDSASVSDSSEEDTPSSLSGEQMQESKGNIPPISYSTSVKSIPVRTHEHDGSITAICCFILPKTGELQCEDRYAYNPLLRRYAVADGVTGSFIPGPWAEFIANGFVEREVNFYNDEAFSKWLTELSTEWNEWMTKTWRPRTDSQRELEGRSVRNWSNKINQVGAQTMLIGCSLLPNTTSVDKLDAHVLSVGDCEFFLFRPDPRGGWAMLSSFPYVDPRQFKLKAPTLATQQELLEYAQKQKKICIQEVHRGDRIVLASDAVAEWLLTKVKKENSNWLPLLMISNQDEFAHYISEARRNGQIKNDDSTMMIISIL